MVPIKGVEGEHCNEDIRACAGVVKADRLRGAMQSRVDLRSPLEDGEEEEEGIDTF